MSPALAGGFLTTAPPGKSQKRIKFLRAISMVIHFLLMSVLVGKMVSYFGGVYMNHSCLHFVIVNSSVPSKLESCLKESYGNFLVFKDIWRGTQ